MVVEGIGLMRLPMERAWSEVFSVEVGIGAVRVMDEMVVVSALHSIPDYESRVLRTWKRRDPESATKDTDI
jgi:hypothetical protein